MLEDSTVCLNVYILRRAAALGHLPPSTGDSPGNYLCVTSFEHLHLIGHILMAYSQRDIRDLLVSRGVAVDSNEDEDEEPEPPTNDSFEASQVQHQPQTEPNPIAVETSLPLRRSESVPVVEAVSSRGGGRGGRGRGRGARDIASSSRPAPSSSHSPDPAAGVTATAPQSNGIPHSSGPRRTDGASRAVEITAAQRQDPKTGIEGELKVYSMLKNVLGDEFTEENWTSELRHLVVPKFKEWKPKDNTTFYADFTFVDKYSNLTEWLKLQETIEASVSAGAGQVVRYHVEVKATNGKAEDPYHMSDWQFEVMKRIAQNPVTSLADGTEVVDKFLIFRVSDLSAGEKPGFAILGEPWNAYANGRCRLRAPGGMWITWN